MIIINKYIPFPGFIAINFFGLIFIREDSWTWRGPEVKAETLNHEEIHTAQMKELLYVFFYIAYFLEWFVRLSINKDAYHNISFEKEAYDHQGDMEYLKTRKHFAQWRNGR